jgi:hypothetical protein
MVERWLQECERASTRPGKACYAAQIYASIGEKDLAFQWLDQAYQERNPLLVPMPRWCRTTTTCAPIRASQRFIAPLRPGGRVLV